MVVDTCALSELTGYLQIEIWCLLICWWFCLSFISWFIVINAEDYLDGLVQERRNSSALAMELRLSYTNPSICLNALNWLRQPVKPMSYDCSSDCVHWTEFVQGVCALVGHVGCMLFHALPCYHWTDAGNPRMYQRTQTETWVWRNVLCTNWNSSHICESGQDCGIFIAYAVEILQCCI